VLAPVNAGIAARNFSRGSDSLAECSAIPGELEESAASFERFARNEAPGVAALFGKHERAPFLRSAARAATSPVSPGNEKSFRSATFESCGNASLVTDK